MRNLPELVYVRGAMGMRGYMIGTRKIILDYFALTDPLLARLTVGDPHNWRIGHFRRAVPRGYVERVTATQRIKDSPSAYGLSDQIDEMERLDFAARMYPISPPELNELYGKLAIVTQLDDLWSYERLKTIVRFNLGAYDHLAEATLTTIRLDRLAPHEGTGVLRPPDGDWSPVAPRPRGDTRTAGRTAMRTATGSNARAGVARAVTCVSSDPATRNRPGSSGHHHTLDTDPGRT